MKKGMWILAALLLVWAFTSTSIASYYYMGYTKYYGLYQDTRNQLGEVSISVNIAIDYGNGTRIWYNSTVLPIGSTLFNATTKVAKYNYTFGTYGVSTEAINNIWVDQAKKMYWMWWYWDLNERKWILGPCAVNEYTLRDDETIIWYYETVATWPPQPPS